VITTQPAAFVTVEEVKVHMDKTDSADDAELEGFVSAACQMIRERIGEVSAVTAVEEHCTRGDTIVLEHRPVISVTTVQQLPGLAVIPEGDEGTGTVGWVLVSREGIVRHTHCWPGKVRFTYQAGRVPLIGNVRLAGLELAAHLWQSSQQNSGGTRPAFGDSETPIMVGSAYALPIRVRELLGLGQNPTDEVLVG
jgi:hypothetical protein